MNHYINTPIENETIKKLNIGDSVFISGTIYVARDAAHKRMQEMLDKKIELQLKKQANMHIDTIITRNELLESIN